VNLKRVVILSDRSESTQSIFKWLHGWAGAFEVSYGLIVLFNPAPAASAGVLMKLDTVVKKQAIKEAHAHNLSLDPDDVVVVEGGRETLKWLDAASAGNYDLLVDATEKGVVTALEKLGLPMLSFPRAIFAS
jgi:hypothetical protein